MQGSYVIRVLRFWQKFLYFEIPLTWQNDYKMNDSKELQWFSDGLKPFETVRNEYCRILPIGYEGFPYGCDSKTKSTSSRTPPYGPNKLFFTALCQPP